MKLPDSFHLSNDLIYRHLDHLSNGPSVGSRPLRIPHSWHKQEQIEWHGHKSSQTFDEYLQEMQKGFSLCIINSSGHSLQAKRNKD
jgi:hypothetical protein